MITTYNLYLFVHLTGVILLTGTFVQAFVVKGLAERIRKTELLKNAFVIINFSDRWITPVASIMILISGILMCLRIEMSIIQTRWIFWSLILFGLMGVIFIARVLPLQKRIERNLDSMINDHSLEKHESIPFVSEWNRYVYFSFVITVIIIVLMIFRPSLDTF